MRDNGTRQQDSESFLHKRVRTKFGKKMLQYVEPVPWGCFSDKINALPLYMFLHQVKSLSLASY